MKTKLLKRLRKQAHDSYRIMPTRDGREWTIEHAIERGSHIYWQRTDEYFADLNQAIGYLEKKRAFEFECLANGLIRDRIYQKRLEQVKNL